ncbi:MAG: hypothetical protein QXG55_06185, partial [Thermoplasmata archaeon]
GYTKKEAVNESIQVMSGNVKNAIERLSAFEKNLRIRILAPKSIKNEFHNYLVGISNKNIKIKIVDSVNIVILGDESTAEFNLPFLNGEIDYSITFFAKNDKAVEWINGLFDYYWETLPGEIIF